MSSHKEVKSISGQFQRNYLSKNLSKKERGYSFPFSRRNRVGDGSAPVRKQTNSYQCGLSRHHARRALQEPPAQLPGPLCPSSTAGTLLRSNVPKGCVRGPKWVHAKNRVTSQLCLSRVCTQLSEARELLCLFSASCFSSSSTQERRASHFYVATHGRARASSAGKQRSGGSCAIR